MIKYKYVTKNILTIKLYTIVYEFNIGVVFKVIIERITKTILLFVVCTDSKLLYNYIIKLRIT